MLVDVLTEVDIARPVSAVAAFASEPTNAPRWYANIRSVEWQGMPGLREGAKVAFVAQFLGRRLAYTYEVVEHQPEQRLVMRTREGPFPMETTYEFRPVGEGSTHMTLRNRGRPSGFSVLMAPLMVPAMRRANRKDLQALKALLERPAR